MDIIEKIAKNICEVNIIHGPKPHLQVLGIIRDRINDIDNKKDKIKFLSIALDVANSSYNEHLKICKTPEDCRKNYEYVSIVYYLQQELQRLGIFLNDDTFTNEEEIIADAKINEVLNRLEKIEFGQEIIYEDITKNIEELKTLKYLGKKNWYELFLGKIFEMTLGGVISETVSKNIADYIKHGIKFLKISN